LLLIEDEAPGFAVIDGLADDRNPSTASARTTLASEIALIASVAADLQMAARLRAVDRGIRDDGDEPLQMVRVVMGADDEVEARAGGTEGAKGRHELGVNVVDRVTDHSGIGEDADGPPVRTSELEEQGGCTSNMST
jgi:hypothetical protein